MPNRTGSRLALSEARQLEIEASRLERKNRKSRKIWKRLIGDTKVREKAYCQARKAEFFKVKILNEKQHKCIALLSDFMNCWGPEYIMGQVGITKETLYKWRNDPFFLRALDTEITRRRTMFRLEAHKQLFKYIRKGRPGLLLAYLKMTGDFKEKIEIEEKTTDDMSEQQLDNEIQALQDELGISSTE